REARLWNIAADSDTQLGLADLRGVDFNKMSREATRMLLRHVNTAAGKFLVTNLDDIAWQDLDHERQLTTQPAEIDPALAELLARTVAPISQSAAELLAGRVIFPKDADKQRPLLKLLGCALQAQLDAKRVTLRADTIEFLRKTTGPCSQTPPNEGKHTGDLKL
ncbi:MAG: hypothetical protein JOY91_01490, partial [Sinobacteraceae bacterium]|nr:hypothetical protein [Nevskiaceae bacterium]